MHKTSSTAFAQMTAHTLANGLRVVLIPRPSAPVVSVAVSYHVGSYSESPSNTGFAHLFEHLMFEGSENVAHGMFDKYCTEAGGENNAYTTFDKTTYYMSLPAHQLELGLWLESDRMAAFGVDQEALEIQKNVVLEEINQNVENQPYGVFSRVQSRLAFAPEAGYHWEVYGEPQHIAASTLEDVRRFFAGFYRPDNACLVLCGDIQPEGALALTEQYFGHIPCGASPVEHKQFLPRYRTGGRYERVEDTIPTETLFCSYHCEGFASDEVYTAEVLSSILSDGMSSRLYKNLVYDRQLAAEINSYIDDRQFTGLFTIYAIANGETTTCAQLHDAVQTVLRDVAENGVTQTEMAKAQNRLKTRVARILQRASGIADEAAHQMLFFQEPERIFTLTERYAAVTAEQVQDFARRIFKPTNEVRIDFVPKPEAA